MQTQSYVTSSVTAPRRALARARAGERAVALRSKAAGFHAVRCGVFPSRPELAPEAARPLTPVELGILAIVRGVRAPGVQVSAAELASKLGCSPRHAKRGLSGLGPCWRPCAGGVCDRPGRNKRGEAKCRGCSRPCGPRCSEHLAIVRRVHQWVVATGALARCGYKRRQCASVLTIPPRNRQRWRPAPDPDVTPKNNSCSSVSPSRKHRVCGTLGGDIARGRGSEGPAGPNRSERASDPSSYERGRDGEPADPHATRGGGHTTFSAWLRGSLPELAELAIGPPTTPRGRGRS